MIFFCQLYFYTTINEIHVRIFFNLPPEVFSNKYKSLSVENRVYSLCLTIAGAIYFLQHSSSFYPPITEPSETCSRVLRFVTTQKSPLERRRIMPRAVSSYDCYAPGAIGFPAQVVDDASGCFPPRIMRFLGIHRICRIHRRLRVSRFR